ncbi:protein kinase, partial [Streptomyces cyaneofuscatus]|uniref:protein kinase domain-containing protein n=1 Tax=Streptomyces cyaneofuscatus TaxID=66883 RepID=UPI0034031E9E
MEALRREDPRRFGRFTVLARFQEAASAVQYVARDTGTGELAVITAARPALAAVPAFRRRFQAEAHTAERLAGGWVTPPLETGSLETGEDELLWTATAYVPALPLAEAVGVAGPLPQRALRILGAGIAEILSRVHAGGSVLQGLAPGTVLLAEDGPRLTAFGPLGAAAAAEARPGGQLSVRLGYLTPEQVAGREVGAPSDLFVLGLLLAYAATGTTPFTEGPPEEAARRIAEADPELDAVPEELRELIAGCLAKDPAERPTAGTAAAELALEGAAGLARGGWLPERLAAAVADQEARVCALEAPEEAEATGTADPAGEPEDAVPADAVPGTAAEAPGDAPATQTPTDPRATVATTDETPGTATANTATATNTGSGDFGEDRGTTRFLNTGPKPPQSDRATTHLALPPGLPPAPGTAPAPLPAPAHHHTYGSPAHYPSAALPPYSSSDPGYTGNVNGNGNC